MKAVCIRSFGGLETLEVEEVARPDPGVGEVLIRAHAAGMNPVDWKTCAGRGVARLSPISFPFIPGWDVSGVIEALGPGFTRFRVGDEVYGFVRFPQPGSTFAEWVTAPVDHIAAKPQSLCHVESAALPCAALTAWQSLVGVARLRPGQRALIHAAAGGVGHVAVQLARYMGAFVIGTASRRNAEYVIDVGAHAFIDYQAARFEDCVRDIDVVLDPIGGDTRDRSWRTLREGGMLVSIQGTPSEEDAERHGVRAKQVLVRPHAGQLAAIAGLVDNGRIRPTISAVYPLQYVRAAFAAVQAGHTRGKVVLQLHPSSGQGLFAPDRACSP